VHPTRLIRTAAFRTTLAYAGVFIVFVFVILLVGYFGTTRLFDMRLREAVEEEHDALSKLFEQSGSDVLVSAVRAREQRARGEGQAYLLQGPAGQVLAGQMAAVPSIEGWREIVPPGAESDEPFLAKGVLLGQGYYLLIARDASILHEAREFAAAGIAWTLGIALPLALVSGLFISSMTLRRIELISATTNRIRDGSLAERVPVSGSGDEFDRLAGSINGMLDAMQDLTEGIRQVSNDIAHDLRTPLTRLRQGLETARRKGRRPEEFKDAIDHALKQVDTILSIFGALLRIGQIEAGTRRAHFAEHSLSELLSSLVETYGPVAADCGKRLDAQITEGLVVLGDQELLTQMMANLIENALEHTPTGTEIVVTLVRERGEALATVSDNGPGIPSEVRDKAFRRFYRLDASRQSPGSGLGLSIVAAIAKLHDIDVELTDNAPGLRVILRFPVSDGSSLPERERSRQQKALDH
jgi:signal transduction histidine kinase